MRPWAERLIDLARPGPGDRCLDVLSESDVLARLLRRAVGPSGTVIELDEDTDAPPGPSTVVVSLFGVAGAADPIGALRRAAAGLDPVSGRLAAAVWAGAAGAPHEAAVRAGLAEVGLSWPDLDAELGLAGDDVAGSLPPGLRLGRLRDVVRFDGTARLWAALVDERRPPAQISAAPPAAHEEARRVCAARLQRHTAADGTLRIPVEALVVERA